MMKSLLSIILVATFIACHTEKRVSINKGTIPEEIFMKSEFYFNDCESSIRFLKAIIITNNSDTTLENNFFKIPFIKSSYEFTKNIFQEECFIGMSVEELNEIFGERRILITAGGKVVTSPTRGYSDFYYLESDNNKLTFDIWIRNNKVERFSVMPNSVDNIRRVKRSQN